MDFENGDEKATNCCYAECVLQTLVVLKHYIKNNFVFFFSILYQVLYLNLWESNWWLGKIVTNIFCQKYKIKIGFQKKQINCKIIG